MHPTSPRVIVIGGGPAGLAAAEDLLVRGAQVSLLTLEPELGGNAAARISPDGRVVEQGQHIMSGFYHQMRGLLERSGVEPDQSTVSAEGRLIVYEDRDDGTHHLRLGPSAPGTLMSGLAYSGLRFSEKLGVAAFMGRTMADLMRGVKEEWDDVCLTAWFLERGMPPSVAATNLLRATREAQFNWPGEVSAYSVLKTLKEMGRDFQSSEIRFPAGSMSDLWWEPIGRRIQALGGRVERGRKLTGLRIESGRLTGLVVERVRQPRLLEPTPDPALRVPTEPDSARLITDFDAVVLAIPVGAMQELLSPEQSTLPGLRGVRRLRTVAPMGLHVWHRAAVTRGPRTVVLGLAPPFGVAVDNKPFNPATRDSTEYGAVLHFVGQETGFEATSDRALLELALASIQRVEGYEGMDMDGVITWELVRDRGPHRRYWLSEPGSLRYKPPRQPGVQGLWLAGDWIRSEEDFPCMETAIRSGRRAARDLLRHTHRTR